VKKKKSASRRDDDMSEMAATQKRTGGSERALKILAKSVHRELRQSGYSRSDIVSFTNELLDLVTTELENGDETIS
jgi:hypothetical protein